MRPRRRRASGTPTPFGDLNEVLSELVGRAQVILGSDVVGAYLQGSMAFGDADMYRDCDFVVVMACTSQHRPSFAWAANFSPGQPSARPAAVLGPI